MGKTHAQVSSLGIINKMVPNGIISMEWAFSDRRKNIQFTPVTKEEGQSLLNIATHKHTFIEKTPQNVFLAEHQPHVVFTLMESFGTNCLIFDNPKTNDLLGKLRPYFNSGFVFKRFLSAFNGTAPSLANLYFHSPIQNISQSLAQRTPLPHTPFLTYKAKGYKTIFITSGNIMWRNLGNYLPLQGVDEVLDQNTIMDIFPEAKKTLSYWGLADEYAFALAEKLLKESTQPLFINILTITNHPPYQVPHHYEVKNIDISHLKGKFSDNAEECKRVLSTFQYAANALGTFIENIERSELADNTIISASGDHHIRGMKLNTPTELFLDKAVPFFIHIPKPIQLHLSLQYDPNRIGSHKDIMPTLYAISLSDTEYWNIGGQNLLSAQQNEFLNFAINESIWADNTGVIDLHSSHYQKYAWKKDIPLLVAHPKN